MLIAERLRGLREAKHLSQGDVEKRTGLLRCYISRVENGHTIPSIETLEKMARALEVPMYQLFYDGEKPPAIPDYPKASGSEETWGNTGKHARFFDSLRRLLSRMNEEDRKVLLFMAQKVVHAAARRASKSK